MANAYLMTRNEAILTWIDLPLLQLSNSATEGWQNTFTNIVFTSAVTQAMDSQGNADEWLFYVLTDAIEVLYKAIRVDDDADRGEIPLVEMNRSFLPEIEVKVGSHIVSCIQ